MCMACPQKVVAYDEGEALVELNGKQRRVKTPFPLAKGEFVLCQAGFVVKKVSPDQADEMLKDFKELNDWAEP